MTPLTKLVFLVSDEGFDAVEDFTQAQARLSMSEPSSQEASDAYAAYTMRKKELLDYIGDLEKRCRIPRQSRVVSLFVNIEPRRNEQPSKYTPQTDGPEAGSVGRSRHQQPKASHDGKRDVSQAPERA